MNIMFMIVPNQSASAANTVSGEHVTVSVNEALICIRKGIISKKMEYIMTRRSITSIGVCSVKPHSANCLHLGPGTMP